MKEDRSVKEHVWVDAAPKNKRMINYLITTENLGLMYLPQKKRGDIFNIFRRKSSVFYKELTGHSIFEKIWWCALFKETFRKTWYSKYNLVIINSFPYKIPILLPVHYICVDRTFECQTTLSVQAPRWPIDYYDKWAKLSFNIHTIFGKNCGNFVEIPWFWQDSQRCNRK